MSKDKQDSLKQMAQSLVTRCDRFERFAKPQAMNPIEALDLLGTLSSVTRDSFPVEEKKPASSPAAKSAVPARDPQPEKVYQSNNPEYQPALARPEIIEALLALQPKAPKKAATQARQQSQATEEAQNPGFVPTEAPQIQGTPKPNPLKTRPDAITQTILHPENS